MTPVRQWVDHLGDFTLGRRVLVLAAWAVPIGAAGAVAAPAPLRLIALITNLVFDQRIDTRLMAPGAGHHQPLLILLAPVIGGLIVGLMARFGSEKIRGHGMPEAIEAILVRGSRVDPRVAVLKPISAAVSIGTGGPFGAEGPIIMTGGAVGFMIGRALGALEAHVLPTVTPGVLGPDRPVGGGSAGSCAPRSPGWCSPLELTHAWPLMLALLVAAVAAYTVSALLLKRSVLTEKVARRGLHLSREYAVDPREVLLVDE